MSRTRSFLVVMTVLVIVFYLMEYNREGVSLPSSRWTVCLLDSSHQAAGWLATWSFCDSSCSISAGVRGNLVQLEIRYLDQINDYDYLLYLTFDQYYNIASWDGTVNYAGFNHSHDLNEEGFAYAVYSLLISGNLDDLPDEVIINALLSAARIKSQPADKKPLDLAKVCNRKIQLRKGLDFLIKQA